MNFGHQWTGGVDHAQVLAGSFVTDGGRDAVGAEDDDGTVGHFCQFLDEQRPPGAQVFDDAAVVDDLLPDVDRLLIQRQCLLHDIDGADHSRAKAARLHEDNAGGGRRGGGDEWRLMHRAPV